MSFLIKNLLKNTVLQKIYLSEKSIFLQKGSNR